MECISADLKAFRHEFWLPAAGVHAKHFTFVHMFQNLQAKQISSAVGGSADQDVAGGLVLLDLLDGLHQSHGFTCMNKSE